MVVMNVVKPPVSDILDIKPRDWNGSVIWSAQMSKARCVVDSPPLLRPVTAAVPGLEIGATEVERARHLGKAAVRLVAVHREHQKHLVVLAGASVPDTIDAQADFLHSHPAADLKSRVDVGDEFALDADDAGLLMSACFLAAGWHDGSLTFDGSFMRSELRAFNVYQAEKNASLIS